LEKPTYSQNTLLFVFDQVLIQNKWDKLQRVLFQLNQISKFYGFKISTKKNTHETTTTLIIIIIIIHILEEVACFKHLGCDINYVYDNDKKCINSIQYVEPLIEF
jgi:hypothetical protein